MNRKIFVVLAFVLLLIITGCSYEKEEVKSDAIKFKEEYEFYNGKEEEGVFYKHLSIDKENPFVYATAADILTKMDNGETFVVYFGYSKCPWCRSVLPALIDACKDLKIKRLYYVDLSEIRDELILDEDGKPVVFKEGSEGYFGLLERFDGILDNYTLEFENKKEIETGEKRIYAPNIISVVDGKAKDLETGVSKKQVSADTKVTEEMEKESYKKFKKILSSVLKTKNSCSLKNAC